MPFKCLFTASIDTLSFADRCNTQMRLVPSLFSRPVLGSLESISASRIHRILNPLCRFKSTGEAYQVWIMEAQTKREKVLQRHICHFCP